LEEKEEGKEEEKEEEAAVVPAPLEGSAFGARGRMQARDET
jgi:hypothetical protein